jgi:hypothetical protein
MSIGLGGKPILTGSGRLRAPVNTCVEGTLMDQILATLRDRAAAVEGRVRGQVIGYALAGVAMVVAGLVFSSIEAARVILGSLAGMAWFTAGYLYWYALSSDRVYDLLNLRSRWTVQRRRQMTIIALAVWLVTFILANKILATVGALAGAIVVVILLCAWLSITMSPQERQEALEAEQAAADAAEQNIWDENGIPAPTAAEEDAPAKKRGLIRRILRGD